MKMINKTFEIKFKHGLRAPLRVQAPDVETAVKLGLAEYRRGYGSTEMTHDWPADRVVESAVPVADAGSVKSVNL